jgi:hypothetical protein
MAWGKRMPPRERAEAARSKPGRRDTAPAGEPAEAGPRSKTPPGDTAAEGEPYRQEPAQARGRQRKEALLDAAVDLAEVLAEAGYPHAAADVDILVATIEGMIARDLVEARPDAIRAMIDTVARLLPALQVTVPAESGGAPPPVPADRPAP